MTHAEMGLKNGTGRKDSFPAFLSGKLISFATKFDSDLLLLLMLLSDFGGKMNTAIVILDVKVAKKGAKGRKRANSRYIPTYDSAPQCF